MSTPYNERTLQIVRDIVEYKRTAIAERGYVEGGDSVDIMANLIATIDALAERLAVAEEHARVEPVVHDEYTANRERAARAWRHVEPMAKVVATRVGDHHVHRDDVTLNEMVWALAAMVVDAVAIVTRAAENEAA
jgi:hypothetical protein